MDRGRPGQTATDGGHWLGIFVPAATDAADAATAAAALTTAAATPAVAIPIMNTVEAVRRRRRSPHWQRRLGRYKTSGWYAPASRRYAPAGITRRQRLRQRRRGQGLPPPLH